jgi:uncharacterized protein
MDDMIVFKVTALTRLTYAAAPAFVARGTGAIINIASITIAFLIVRSARIAFS